MSDGNRTNSVVPSHPDRDPGTCADCFWHHPPHKCPQLLASRNHAKDEWVKATRRYNVLEKRVCLRFEEAS